MLCVRNTVVDGNKTDILIENGNISKIAPSIEADCESLDASETVALPGLVNMHTHAAMALLRGYGDDMKLQDWLENKVWPVEAKMTEEDVYIGTLYAIQEMISSGTTFMNDQYWHFEAILKAVVETGIHTMMGPAYLDLHDPERLKEIQKENERLFEKYGSVQNVQYAIEPHSIYTVSLEGLKWASKFAKENNIHVHMHLSETEKEVADCKKEHGLLPVQYLEKHSILQDNMIFAHGCYLTEEEIQILSNYHVTVVHNPVSNMKLATGRAMPYELLNKHGVTVTLGTDGACSNNTLDMFDTMKCAALLQKHATGDPTVCPAPDVLDMATKNAYEYLGIKSGVIKEGYRADLILVDTKHCQNNPLFDVYSNAVYALNGSAVKHTVINGNICMRNYQIEGFDEIQAEFNKTAQGLVNR